jgi:hypothetical protein
MFPEFGKNLNAVFATVLLQFVPLETNELYCDPEVISV